MEEARNATESITLTGKLLEFRNALESEIETIERSGQSSTLLTSGKRVKNSGADYWYSFKVEYLPAIPADTPCKLTIERNSYDVTVVSFDESEIIISSNTELPDNMSTAKLENGSAILMERLIKRIEDNSRKENPAGNRMLPDDGKSSDFSQIYPVENIVYSGNLTTSQIAAVDSALSNDITYIWGPPGTGKTTVIGDIIRNLYKNNRSVLVVSHTNVAVDGAIEKAVKEKDGKVLKRNDGSCPVLRLGIPQKDLPEEVLLEHHTKVLGEDLYARKREIEKEQEQYRKSCDEAMLLIDKFNWIETSNIEAIKNSIEEEDESFKKVQSWNYELEKQKDKEAQFIVDHPEVLKHSEYQREAERLEKKCKEEEDLLRRIDENIPRYKNNIVVAQEEIAKHRVYNSLSQQISEKMPESFLVTKLAEYDRSINAIVGELQNLTNRDAELTATIANGQRNAISAFLSKKNIENAEKEKATNNARQIELRNSFATLKQTRDSYQAQLTEVRSLNEQLKDVVPKESENYWVNKKEEAERAIQSAEETREGASRIYADLQASLTKCKELLNSLGNKAKEYETIVETIKSIQNKCNYLSDIYHKALNKTNDLIGEEIARGRRFLPDNIESISARHALLDVLEKSLEEIASTIAGVDRVAVENSLNEARMKLRELSTELQEIEEKINNLIKEAINKAEIVGATLAKAYLSDFLQERQFDTVILDEASMASIPALWCASYLAEKNIIIVGDFLQLPPIVMSEDPIAKQWLGKDIFAASGMQEKAKDASTKPKNFIMLNEQFRMESEIANISNIYYGEYGGLISNDELSARVKEREYFYSWFPGEQNSRSVEIIDTSELHAWVTSVPQGKKHSRLNCFSAALCVEMAFCYVTNYMRKIKDDGGEVKAPKVIIVAPYKPHVDRIRRLIEIGMGHYGLPKDLGLIKAGTIHSFQGNEADIVIFDLVIDEPHWKANLFITDSEANASLKKMFNVAVTRAKFKLFVVGNIGYCLKRAKNNALRELLDKLIVDEKFHVNNAKEMFPHLSVSIPRSFAGEGIDMGDLFVCQESEYYDHLLEDIHSVEKRMIIFSPFMTENRLARLLPVFHDSINMGKEIIVITRPLSDRGKSEVTHYQKCEKELIDIGVKVIHKKGMHEKLVIIDDSVVWTGSLNTLSFAGNTGEVMTRVHDTKYTMGMEEMYGISNIQTAIDSQYELSCPICKSPMNLGESDKGGLYWKCSNCDYGRDFKQQYPVDGILRCQCGGLYQFAMKNQPRWVCSNNPKHYQIMRKGDLKLEKMAALIPTKRDRKAVDAYFEAKAKDREEKKRSTSTSAATSIAVSRPVGEGEQLSFADLGLM